MGCLSQIKANFVQDGMYCQLPVQARTKRKNCPGWHVLPTASPMQTKEQNLSMSVDPDEEIFVEVKM